MSTKKSTGPAEVENGFRMGTKKNKMYSRFVASGPEAAKKYGLSAGLAPSTVNQWVTSWQRAAEGGTSPVPKRKAKAPAGGAEAAAPAAKKSPSKKSSSPKKKKAAVIIEEGQLAHDEPTEAAIIPAGAGAYNEAAILT